MTGSSTRSESSKPTAVRTAAVFLALVFTMGAFCVWTANALAEAGTADEARMDELLAARDQTKQEINDLNKSIDAKKASMDDLQRQIEGYNRKIDDTRAKAASLDNEIEILGNKIAKTELDIKRTQDEMDTVTLEIRALELQIRDKNERIAQGKASVAEYVRTLYTYDNRSDLEVLLANDSFSEFFDQVKYLEDVEKDISGAVEELVVLKHGLEKEQSSKSAKKQALADLQKRLDATRLSLEEAKDSKVTLVDQAEQSAGDLARSVQELRNEQARIDSDLASIQNRLKEKLRENDKFANLPQNTVLSWPVSPDRGLSTYFHDPDYPFRYLFEHPAIDIRAYQGTPIKAAASGFIARARDAGKGYSYIMIIHPGNVATVYGHVSKIMVQEDQFVERGQVIGYSGGTPGTPGAGNLTTGPHLHFEVRLDGIPVNPLDYLLSS